MSPITAFAGAVGARRTSFWLFAALPIFLLGWRRGSWFCSRLCPTGLLAQQASRLRPSVRHRVDRWPRLGRTFLAAIFGGAVLGYPLLIWLDPLTLFNGFFSPWPGRAEPAVWGLAVGLLLILAASCWRPGCWCRRLCPLGALLDLSLRARVALARKRARPHRPDRRMALGLLVGGAGAFTLRAVGRRAPTPVRPPGAMPEEVLGGLCARCGNCFQTCPAGIIRPDLGQGHAGTLLAPRLDFSEKYCHEQCAACGAVCPTGALAGLSLEEKRRRRLGIARVNRDDCVAWGHGGYCMACQEACPYDAIDEEWHGVPCPVVREDRCRGCGACEARCPVRPDRAIRVRARGRQGAIATGSPA